MTSQTAIATHFCVVAVPPTADASNSDNLYAEVVQCLDLARAGMRQLAPSELPESVPLFCLPEGVSTLPRNASPGRQLTYFSFVLTNADGSRMYGHCALCYEPLIQRPDVLASRVYCLLSPWPVFSLSRAFLGSLLRHAYSDVRKSLEDGSARTGTYGSLALPGDVSPELLLSTFMATLRIPPAGFRLAINFDFHTIMVQRDLFSTAFPPVDAECFRVLLSTLSVSNIVTVVTALLLEQRVLLHSEHVQLLTPLCEAISSLLFPFVWPHVYIPVLPLQLVEYLQAPCAFLIGAPTSFLKTRHGLEALMTSVVVHVDVDRIVMPMQVDLPDGSADDILPQLPVDMKQRLIAHLSVAIPSYAQLLQTSFKESLVWDSVATHHQLKSNCNPQPHSKHMNCDHARVLSLTDAPWVYDFRAGFLDVFAQLFRNYRDYLTVRLSVNSNLLQFIAKLSKWSSTNNTKDVSIEMSSTDSLSSTSTKSPNRFINRMKTAFNRNQSSTRDWTQIVRNKHKLCEACSQCLDGTSMHWFIGCDCAFAHSIDNIPLPPVSHNNYSTSSQSEAMVVTEFSLLDLADYLDIGKNTLLEWLAKKEIRDVPPIKFVAEFQLKAFLTSVPASHIDLLEQFVCTQSFACFMEEAARSGNILQSCNRLLEASLEQHVLIRTPIQTQLENMSWLVKTVRCPDSIESLQAVQKKVLDSFEQSLASCLGVACEDIQEIRLFDVCTQLHYPNPVNVSTRNGFFKTDIHNILDRRKGIHSLVDTVPNTCGSTNGMHKSSFSSCATDDENAECTADNSNNLSTVSGSFNDVPSVSKHKTTTLSDQTDIRPSKRTTMRASNDSNSNDLSKNSQKASSQQSQHDETTFDNNNSVSGLAQSSPNTLGTNTSTTSNVSLEHSAEVVSIRPIILVDAEDLEEKNETQTHVSTLFVSPTAQRAARTCSQEFLDARMVSSHNSTPDHKTNVEPAISSSSSSFRSERKKKSKHEKKRRQKPGREPTVMHIPSPPISRASTEPSSSRDIHTNVVEITSSKRQPHVLSDTTQEIAALLTASMPRTGLWRDEDTYYQQGANIMTADSWQQSIQQTSCTSAVSCDQEVSNNTNTSSYNISGNKATEMDTTGGSRADINKVTETTTNADIETGRSDHKPTTHPNGQTLPNHNDTKHVADSEIVYHSNSSNADNSTSHATTVSNNTFTSSNIAPKTSLDQTTVILKPNSSAYSEHPEVTLVDEIIQFDLAACSLLRESIAVVTSQLLRTVDILPWKQVLQSLSHSFIDHVLIELLPNAKSNQTQVSSMSMSHLLLGALQHVIADALQKADEINSPTSKDEMFMMTHRRSSIIPRPLLSTTTVSDESKPHDLATLLRPSIWGIAVRVFSSALTVDLLPDDILFSETFSTPLDSIIHTPNESKQHPSYALNNNSETMYENTVSNEQTTPNSSLLKSLPDTQAHKKQFTTEHTDSDETYSLNEVPFGSFNMDNNVNATTADSLIVHTVTCTTSIPTTNSVISSTVSDEAKQIPTETDHISTESHLILTQTDMKSSNKVSDTSLESSANSVQENTMKHSESDTSSSQVTVENDAVKPSSTEVLPSQMDLSVRTTPDASIKHEFTNMMGSPGYDALLPSLLQTSAQTKSELYSTQSTTNTTSAMTSGSAVAMMTTTNTTSSMTPGSIATPTTTSSTGTMTPDSLATTTTTNTSTDIVMTCGSSDPYASISFPNISTEDERNRTRSRTLGAPIRHVDRKSNNSSQFVTQTPKQTSATPMRHEHPRHRLRKERSSIFFGGVGKSQMIPESFMEMENINTMLPNSGLDAQLVSERSISNENDKCGAIYVSDNKSDNDYASTTRPRGNSHVQLDTPVSIVSMESQHHKPRHRRLARGSMLITGTGFPGLGATPTASIPPSSQPRLVLGENFSSPTSTSFGINVSGTHVMPIVSPRPRTRSNIEQTTTDVATVPNDSSVVQTEIMGHVSSNDTGGQEAANRGQKENIDQEQNGGQKETTQHSLLSHHPFSSTDPSTQSNVSTSSTTNTAPPPPPPHPITTKHLDSTHTIQQGWHRRRSPSIVASKHMLLQAHEHALSGTSDIHEHAASARLHMSTKNDSLARTRTNSDDKTSAAHLFVRNLDTGELAAIDTVMEPVQQQLHTFQGLQQSPDRSNISQSILGAGFAIRVDDDGELILPKAVEAKLHRKKYSSGSKPSSPKPTSSEQSSSRSMKDRMRNWFRIKSPQS